MIGAWGDEISAQDRFAVCLELTYSGERPEVMAPDADRRAAAHSDLVSAALTRAAIIGTPLAPQVFSLVDAIFLQDERLPFLLDS